MNADACATVKDSRPIFRLSPALTATFTKDTLQEAESVLAICIELKPAMKITQVYLAESPGIASLGLPSRALFLVAKNAENRTIGVRAVMSTLAEQGSGIAKHFTVDLTHRAALLPGNIAHACK
jgi:hypothetical protein